MAEITRHDVELTGCAPEPLMSYLKALGILRLVSEQKDSDAHGWWQNDVFHLRTTLDRDALVRFFLEEYRPTPIVVPWSGSDFFDVESGGNCGLYSETPTATTVIEAFLASTTDRLAHYRDGIYATLAAMAELGITKKEDIDTQKGKTAQRRKAFFFSKLRQSLADDVVAWIDAAGVCANDLRFSTLLGSGGGSDGNTHFSDNFMQNLWDVLSDFDVQRGYAIELKAKSGEKPQPPEPVQGQLRSEYDKKGDKLTVVSRLPPAECADRVVAKNPSHDKSKLVKRAKKAVEKAENTRLDGESLLQQSLFLEASSQLVLDRTSSLFDSGAVGGPNATQGMERDSLANPWNVILALEGAIAFAGAAAKRLGANVPSEAVFPFQVSAIATGNDGLADNERAGSEVWLPLWARPALAAEVLRLLNEGRAQCGGRQARSGIDMARAAATLGVDRGIDAFSRYAIVKGRVGGDNYNTAACLGRFEVREQREADLLRQIDPWLDLFRWAVRTSGGQKKDTKPIPRFLAAIRVIDSAVFDFCKYGGAPFFQRILIALGQAERELALTPGKVGQSKFPPGPLAGLSADWISAADDDSTEFAVAWSLAFIRDQENMVGPLRANLEPVTVWYGSNERKQKAKWAEKDRAVVWNAADLPTNLANVLQRRMMDAGRAGCERLPLASRFTTPLDTIATFLAGDLDDRRVEQLTWGLTLVDPRCPDDQTSTPYRSSTGTPTPPLPREYALLKLLFLPQPLAVQRQGESWRWQYAGPDDPGIAIRPEPRILPLVRAGRIGEACRIAAQRLRISGLPTMPGPLPTGVMRDDNWRERTTDTRTSQRLAAALLIPVSSSSVNRLVHLVCREPTAAAAAESLALAAEGATE